MKHDHGDGPNRFFFVHLQKTAGTTLFRRLRHHFGRDAVYPMPRYQGNVEATLDVDLLVERFAAHRDEIRLVTGHFPLCTTELLDADFAVFTLLREPVERTLSFLRHQREVAPEFAGASLSEIYRDPLCRDGLLRNHMVRMLSLTVEEMTAGALTEVTVDEARLERAKANLSDRIDVVGVQERFDDFCEELTERFGWDLGNSHVANRTTPVEVPDSLRSQIAADNEIDGELYRFVVDHCLKSTPTLATEEASQR
ncbi:MAG: sulfotransferase family 2 domain-containing protein [Acidimicrobiia bacterium]|nr:sulfotransferase family 2 domain-containing protein [Acidimicrobiia bacterium]